MYGEGVETGALGIFSFIQRAHTFLLAGNQFIFFKEVVATCFMWNVANFMTDEAGKFLGECC